MKITVPLLIYWSLCAVAARSQPDYDSAMWTIGLMTLSYALGLWDARRSIWPA